MAATTSIVRKPPASSSLADVLEIILDRGIVIDAYVRVALVGIEILTIDARIVIASVDTYLRFAEAVDRLALGSARDAKGLSELTGDTSKSSASGKTQGMLEGVKESFHFGSSDKDEEKQEQEQQQKSEKQKSEG